MILRLMRKRCWEILETNELLDISKLDISKFVRLRHRDRATLLFQQAASYATETKSRSDARYL